MVAFFLLPSFAVAVIVTVPFFLAVTLPLELTVAIFLLEDFHVTFVLSAVAGVTLAFKVWLFFTFMDLLPVIATFVTLTLFLLAFRVIFALFLLPSFAVAVIVAFPAFLTFTLPLLFTVATFVLLDFQVTFLFAASFGVTVVLKLYDLPTFAFRVPFTV